MNSKVAILIPCYKPTEILRSVVQEIRNLFDGEVVLVSDGNSIGEVADLKKIKTDFNADLVIHATNLGKGRALKTGFNYILTEKPSVEFVVTADSDGQHKTLDMLKLIDFYNKNPETDLVLGVRQFKNNIPLRSKIGNNLTVFIFRHLVGLKISDTQTGLRGMPRRILVNLLKTPGERYEFETNMLLETKKLHWSLREVAIDTVYINNNAGSHFNPILDSMRIYFLILRFLGSALLSAVIDFVIYALFIYQGVKIYHSMLLARFISGWFNFYMNRNVVFRHRDKPSAALIRYWSLVVVMGTLSSFIVNGLMPFFPKPVLLKLLAEPVLFLASFAIQKEFVFNTKDK